MTSVCLEFLLKLGAAFSVLQIKEIRTSGYVWKVSPHSIAAAKQKKKHTTHNGITRQWTILTVSSSARTKRLFTRRLWDGYALLILYVS